MTSLRRLCFLGAKHGMLVSVLNDCILSVTNFRKAISKMDKKGVEIAFMEFDENTELFCNGQLIFYIFYNGQLIFYIFAAVS